MQNIAVFRLIFGFLVPRPNKCEKWQICPLFVSRPNTYELVSKSPNCTKVTVNDFVVSICMQKRKKKKHFSLKKVEQIIQDRKENFLEVKNYVFLRNEPRLPYLMSLM